MNASLDVDLDLIRKYDVPGPRYTSYPTAPQFRDDVDDDVVLDAIRRNNEVGGPLSLYVHIPFCQSLCWYCGCTKIIGKNSDRTEPYLETLDREMQQKSEFIDARRPVVQVHFGGGTPTYLEPGQIRWLGERIDEHFNVVDEAEVSVEIDPRRLTEEHVEALVEAGFNRASIGIQDNNPKVQEAIHRIQPFETTRRVAGWLSEAGFRSLNVDLIYGLPHQTVESFDRTLSEVLTLEPGRFAIYTYAHVPWIHPAQKLLEGDALPGPEQKLTMQKHIVERLTGEGYDFVGMDHYAQNDDELAKARRAGTLRRNFQGYSTQAGVDIYAFGMSGISQIGDLYLQNPKEISDYTDAVDASAFPNYRARVLDDDDRIRRRWIMALMCHGRLEFDGMSEKLGIDVVDYFEEGLARLEPMERDGLVELDAQGLTVTDRGRLLLRNICMPFDAYIDDGEGRYSRTV